MAQTQSIPEAWGARLHVCVSTQACAGPSLALLERSRGMLRGSSFPGHLLGAHSVTHLGALETSLFESADVGDRDEQTEVWSPQWKDER